MVDFPLKAVVSAVTTQAESSLNILKGKLTGVSDQAEASSQKQTASWGRVQQTILGVTAVATGLVAAMVASSPELAAALSEIKFQFQEVANALGNELAPIVEAFIPLISKLTDWFIGLPQPVKQFIAVTIALTAVIGTLTIAVIALMAVSWPVVALVVGLAAAIAAIIALWQNWNEIVSYTTNLFDQYRTAITLILIALGPIGWTILGIITIFEQWGNIIQWLQGLWEGFMGFMSNATGFIADVIESVLAPVKAVINAMIEWINDNIIAWVNNTMIPAINTVLPSRWELSSISYLPTFHGGGIVGDTNTGTGEVLAKLEYGEGVIDVNTMRNGIRGGNTTNMGGVTVIQHFRFNGQVQPRQVMKAAEIGVKNGTKNLQRYTRSGYSS